jgi:hypothetical protein
MKRREDELFKNTKAVWGICECKAFSHEGRMLELAPLDHVKLTSRLEELGPPFSSQTKLEHLVPTCCHTGCMLSFLVSLERIEKCIQE